MKYILLLLIIPLSGCISGEDVINLMDKCPGKIEVNITKASFYESITLTCKDYTSESLREEVNN
jgi:hypothetical protein